MHPALFLALSALASVGWADNVPRQAGYGAKTAIATTTTQAPKSLTTTTHTSTTHSTTKSSTQSKVTSTKKSTSSTTKKTSSRVTSFTTSTSTTTSAAPARTVCTFADPITFFRVYDATTNVRPKPFYGGEGNSSIRDIHIASPGYADISWGTCPNDVNCNGVDEWFVHYSDIGYEQVFIPRKGGPLRVYLDRDAARASGLVGVTADLSDFYCQNGTDDAFPIFKAVGNETVQVPYQCGQDLHLYGVKAKAPTGCKSVILQAETIPGA
nr:hypothetical protein CFP56_07456 [Quercus suber]